MYLTRGGCSFCLFDQNDPDNVGKKVKDYWEAAQKSILTDANKLLANLKTYDKDNIDDKVIEEIEPFMTMAEFTPEVRAVRHMCPPAVL